VAPWVFFYPSQPIGAHLDGWREACERAGVPNLLFHDLRRSAVRNMMRAGIPRPVEMAMTGHKTESMYRRTTSRVKPISAVRASRWSGIR
jgi:integrase